MPSTLKPANATQVAEIVLWAMSEETSLAVQGFGSKTALGRQVEAEHVLELSGLTGISAYEPEELTLRALPGTPLTEISAALDGAGQRLAFEPPDYAQALHARVQEQSIGGIIASNLSGPRRIAAGAARDHFLGFEAVSGRGETFKAGGHVVKNVTGYDLCKLMAGSFGTLAVLVDVTLKALPKPETEATCLVQFADTDEGLSVLREMTGTSLELSGFAFLDADAAANSRAISIKQSCAALRSEGDEATVSARISRLKELLPAGADALTLDEEKSQVLWQEIRDVTLLNSDANCLWRCSLPPAAAAQFLAATADQMAENYVCDWAGGLIWLSAPIEQGPTIRAAAGEAGGHAMIFYSTEAKAEVRSPLTEPMMKLHQQIKAGFDPRGILNPGRMFGEL